MAGFRELREEWQVTETSTGVFGTRAFLQLAGGTDSLPELGDDFSVEFPASKCVSINRFKYHTDVGNVGCDIDQHKYICEYTSDPPEAEEIDTSFSAGAEVTSFDAKDSRKWFWMDSSTPANKEQCHQRLWKSSVRGTISNTQDFLVDELAPGDLTTFLKFIVHPKLGKINNAEFVDLGNGAIFKAGNLLFSTYSVNKIRNFEGDDTWRLTLNFTYRIIDNGLGNTESQVNTVEDSWHYLLYSGGTDDPTAPNGTVEWRKVTKSTASVPDPNKDFLYIRTDFTSLVSTWV